MVSIHGHSAKVKLTLIVGDRQLPLGRVRPGEAYLREACGPIQATNGTIVVSVDGVEHHSDVFLPHGIGTDGERVVYF